MHTQNNFDCFSFHSKWITTKRFLCLSPIDVFHKELDHRPLPESPITNYHTKFRKKIFLDHFQSVMIRISADDYYKLYINGNFVCQGPAPAYPDFYNYNEIDISQYVKAGENILAVHVYYQGLINRVWNSGDNRQGLIADLYVDGTYLCGTDRSWKYNEAKEYSGEIIGYHTAFTENIDFQKKEANWKQLSFDDSHYLSSFEADHDDHRFVRFPVECLDVYRVFPHQITKINAGSYLIDFGREIVGQFSMICTGKSGETVSIMCAEELDADNPADIRYRMRCNCDYLEICVLSGQRDEFEFYDYKAFRYVKVVASGQSLHPDSFCAVMRHHKFVQKVFLKTDQPNLGRIWDLCVYTLKCGVQEGFLDCPSREKGQYLGDFTVSGLAYMYVTKDSRIYRKTLLDFARTAGICSGLMSVAPGSHMQEIADFSLQYPMQVLHYYQYTNDLDTVKELYPTVCGILKYFESYQRPDGLLEGVNEKWNLVDWPQNLRDGYAVSDEDKGQSPSCHNVLNAFYIAALSSADRIRQLLDIPTDDTAQRVTEAYINAFYDKDRCLFSDTQDKSHYALHSNVLPVAFGIAPGNAHGTIREMILQKGLSCGTQFSYFVLKALAAMGAYEDELNLILNKSEHSWMNMLREGATTCFEAWGKEQKWNTSLCHPWSCAPVIAIIEDIAGAKSTLWHTDGTIHI